MKGTTGFAHLYIDQYYRFDFYSDELHEDDSLDLAYIVIENEGPYSWLESDYNFQYTNGVIRMLYYSDYNIGSNWVTQIMECQYPINGDYFSIDLYSPMKGYVADNVCSTYTAVSKESVSQRNLYDADFL